MKKKSFSSFNQREAFKFLNLSKTIKWKIEYSALNPSKFLQQRLERLERIFDLKTNEKSKELIIDAICEEALDQFELLKIWKGAALASDGITGNVDYLIAESKDYLEAPFLCVVEAKNDDFIQSFAQCLVEMKACQLNNQEIGKYIDVFGIVTNGETWKFYRLTINNIAYETLPYSISDIPTILGILHNILTQCQQYLEKPNDPSKPLDRPR